ncbi:MAG: maintenance system killer protein [Muribaculaceae bacterium]
MNKTKAIHIKDAIVLLESKQPCNLKVWKLRTGDILLYQQVICVGKHWRGGTHRIRLPQSGVLREFRDITLFEINGMEVYR